MARPTDNGPTHRIDRQLALDPGDNTIEVVAYNGANLLASPPARATVKFIGSGDAVKPKLYVLAIGINAYMDKGWRPAGSADTVAFPPWKLAVNDAMALAAALEMAGAQQYTEVKITEALDSNASLTGLERIVAHASEINPRDTFVLFAAAHATSHDGRYYLIPQDYDGGNNPDALRMRAVGQDRLQDWLTNRIRAKRAILLLDTCASGALVGAYLRSRTDSPTSEAAIGRLHEATGRPVLTAAAEGKPAFEGYEGHGVFTWALLDALRNGEHQWRRLHRTLGAGFARSGSGAENSCQAERTGSCRSCCTRIGRPSAIGALRFPWGGLRGRPTTAEFGASQVV